MEKILISACIVGERCRYDGKNNYTPLVKELLEKCELVPFCPEVEGGLPIPRDPSERKKDLVLTKDKKNVTRNFQKGAELALNICQYLGIHIAILTEYSPSCGVNQIHDGTFSNRLIAGSG